jgi:CubicO group peptidase (beta-lactamase class C family)
MVDFKDLAETILNELEETKTPGAAFAIVKGDKIIYSEGFGKSTIDTDAPITPDSLLRTASTGKIFTAAVLSKFAEDGKLQFNVPIREYAKGLSPRIGELTVHQLLTHTAGLIDAFKFTGRADDQALREAVHSWNEDLFFQEPDTFFSYSNYGYSIAGLVIEELSGKTYAQALEEILLKPAGMNQTTFPAILAKGVADVRPEGDKAKLYKGFRDHAAFRPVGFHLSTVNDLARFAIAVLNKGRVNGQQVFTPGLFERLCVPQIPTLTHSSSIYYTNAKYGYGVFQHQFRGMRVVGHPGQLIGFGSRLLWMPDFQIAIAVMTNGTGVTLTKSVEKAMELFLPLQPKRIRNEEVSMNEEEFIRYTGMYYNPAKLDQVVEILVKDKKLFIKDIDKEYPLMKIGPHDFTNALEPDLPSSDFVFIADSTQKITHRHKGLRAWVKM